MEKLANDKAPYIRTSLTKQKIMLHVLLALFPAALAGVYFFGLDAGLIIIVSLVTALIADNIFQWISKEKHGFFNGSAIVTALLLALILPPTVPLWIPALGVIFALGLGKYAFGASNNIFNPALIGRAILVISWPKLMSTWVTPDGITAATPLMVIKDKGIDAALSADGYMDLFLGNIGGCIGETSALLLLLGGMYLIFIRIIDWRIPLAYISTLAFLVFISGQDILFHVLAGGLLIGAFFMATDYVTIPITTNGRWIFAIGCGLLTFIFRTFSSMPEGVMYSILIMNAAYPTIERFTMPKPFGHSKHDKDLRADGNLQSDNTLRADGGGKGDMDG